MSSDKTKHSLQNIYLAFFWRNSDISGLAAELDFFVWPLVVAHRATIAQGGVGARNGHPNTVSDLACLWSEDRGGVNKDGSGCQKQELMPLKLH